jgi:hypothetical protein
MSWMDSKVNVIDQPFEPSNPLPAFKYFDMPKAIIVDRDPRDVYLFGKNFLKKARGVVLYPVDDVESFISWYKAVRTSPDKLLHEREDCLFINFEELIYDYENAVKKVSEFCGIKEWGHKGEFFKPNWSRNNTQLFNKYKGFEKDIAKIEMELPEFIFHFHNYPDTISEGEMFFGSQSRRK